ncbi:MAG: histidine--tRNA ligase [Deltaproteobacteria bacterium RIFCSPLOWO2_01_44_7]|nr:MAG: histidine--tRNA ligase [Deltaproteobacteria bacterium RIFCSPHIGHO2_01_FULL_43_49]OGQ38263.1 MAG: histidine--tRNA ligase [Deltaproteobacteria bacterium RIFCSPLOWO2_01_44_7]OGQ43507.1 MAG: histidine--tRNA ligase [Deltaproteobacteria bacterium RIFCSPLOWO2_02_FULL_44_34]
MNKIEPTILKGTRDFLPQEMMRRNAVMEIIRKAFEQFGYSPIETPIICPAETILGKYGEEGDRLTYSFKDRGGRLIALPYDLTVPFARFVAANYQDLPMPFKRYQIQRVWRAEKPQKGRLREFYQCDIDIIGSKSLICEAEIAKIIVSVFERLRIPNITIKVNSRRLMNAILQSFGIDQNDSLAVIRIIDKIAKIGKEAVISELRKMGIDNAEKIIATLTPEGTNKSTLEKISKYDIAELKEFLSYCTDLGVPEKNIQIDPTLARGLDYYTGLTFEVISEDADFGSICAGGRYDNLCGLFSDKDFSGVGVAFGFERIMLLLEQLKITGNGKAPSQVIVTIFDENSVKDALQTYSKLIEANIATEIYFEPDKLSKQFKFADKKQIPFVLIQGPEEREKQEITIKRLQNGKQKTIPVNQLVSYLSNYYEAQ